MRITYLSDNNAGFGAGCLAEWGLSILVEHNRRRILLDTGRDEGVILHNADRMKVGLENLDWLVLSHGHYDHTGGLADLLGRASPLKVAAHPGIFTPKYVKRPQGEYANIGLVLSREELEARGARFTLSRGPVKLAPGVTTLGEVPDVSGFEPVDTFCFVKQGGRYRKDPLDDDLAMVVTRPYGLVVITGCAHKGIINTLRQAQKVTGRKKIHAVFGGAHLFRADDERLDKTVAALAEMGVERIAPSHCTGFEAAARLRQVFGKGFQWVAAGTVIELP
jgi:7,8-dihydropterin-6-yl-methyl-4-(beta-D-ribofuranosyl)aminobenzene 5'-phosphate synthase